MLTWCSLHLRFLMSANFDEGEFIQRASQTKYGHGVDQRQFVLYARKGFTTALRKRAAAQPGIVLHTPQTMLRQHGDAHRRQHARRTHGAEWIESEEKVAPVVRLLKQV